jgi:S1-C subfamily serine protease
MTEEAPMAQSQSNPTLQDLSDTLSELVAHAAGSVVAVHSDHARSSGFVWRSGLIIAADEALADDGDVHVVLPGGETVAAAVVGRDPTTDVALLRIDRSDLSPVVLQSTQMRVGALALAVGSWNGAPISAFGTVSFAGERWRSLRGGEIDARIELDIAMRRIGEGGFAVDASGHVFGMAVFGPRRRVLVIPAGTIERVAGQLLTHGRIVRGYLGLGLQAITLDGDQRTGVMVMSVDPQGPGARAGLQQGDVILKWNDQSIRDMRMLLSALGPDSVGTRVSLALRRGGAPVEASVNVSERQEA